MSTGEFRAADYRSADGLDLYARDYGPAAGGAVPVLCLPGLTRNCRDFDALARRLSAERRVVCPDFRGRGRSQYAADSATYRPDVEMADTLALLDHLKIERAAAIGTSRGGIVALLMVAKAKERLAGVAFNDIGPRIDKAGLLRIRTYLGRSPAFRSWDEAAAALIATHPGFTGLGPADWLRFAHSVFRDENGLPRNDYDAAIADHFPATEAIAEGKVPELWGLYDQLAPLPALVLRGEASDLLSAATVAEMQARYPALAAVTVRGRGHVPFLDEPEALAALDTWLAATDRAEKTRS